MPSTFADALFWIAVICCAAAQLAIFRSLAAARPRRAAEVLWAVLPSLALAAVLVATWRAIHPTT